MGDQQRIWKEVAMSLLSVVGAMGVAWFTFGRQVMTKAETIDLVAVNVKPLSELVAGQSDIQRKNTEIINSVRIEQAEVKTKVDAMWLDYMERRARRMHDGP